MILRRASAVIVLCVPAAIFIAAWPYGSAADRLILPLEHRPVSFHSEDEMVTDVGSLKFRGGIEVSSKDDRFGGLSGLLVSPDGRTMTAVTDAGDWITARLDYGRRGALVGIGDGRIGRLADPTGRPLTGKSRGDAESLARMGGSFVVAFEQNHRIWVYPAGREGSFLGSRPRPYPLPLPGGPGNRGLEAMSGLPNGGLLAITEGFDIPNRGVRSWAGDGKAWREMAYRRTGLFRPTGAATLPGGGVLVLERRFTWIGGVASRIVRLSAQAVSRDAVLTGDEVALIEAPLTVENFEGIAVRRSDRGETLVYIVSDDNFSALQRTILFMFAMNE